MNNFYSMSKEVFKQILLKLVSDKADEIIKANKEKLNALN